MIIYAFLALLLFGLGMGGRRCSVAALFVMAVGPFSNGFSDFTYQSGAYAYDFYFIATGIRMILSVLLRQRIIKIGGLALPIVGFMVAYSLFYRHWEGLTYFLKDYRPAIFVLEAMALAWRLKVNEAFLMSRSTALLLVCAGGAASVFWMLVSLLGLVVHRDTFYDANSYRYLGMSTYVAIVYLIYHLSPVGADDAFGQSVQQSLLGKVALIASVAALLACGGRTLIGVLAVVIVVTNSTSIRRFSATVVLSVCLVVLFVGLSEHFGADRVAQGLQSGGAQAQFLTRFGPALDRIREMNGLQYLVGLGFGTTFEIPWFDYRGLDVDNTFVDCAYLTFYVKYGVFGIGMIIFHFGWQSRSFFPSDLSRRLALPLFLLVAGLCVTYAVPYQSVAPGLLIGYVAVCCMHDGRAQLSRPSKIEPAEVGA